MLRNILLINSLFFFLFLASCEEFYNFEANKLNEKNRAIVEKSQTETDPSKKLIMLNEVLKNYNKIQKRYKKTKIARKHRKEKIINKIEKEIENLTIIALKEKNKKKKNKEIDNIRNEISLANVEFKNSNIKKSINHLLTAAELSISQIGDTRTKARLENQIANIRINLKTNEKAFINLKKSEEFTKQIYIDLPKKIKHLSNIYIMLNDINKKNEMNEIQNSIYKIINDEIKNNDNKASALLEIINANLKLKNIEKVNNDLNTVEEYAEKSSTYLEIAKIYYKINNKNKMHKFLEKSKNAAKLKDQEFWIVRELINVALFENNIFLKKESNLTLIEAKKYIPENPDGRLVLELITAYAKISNFDQAEELLKLIKPGYEKSMAMAVIGKELALIKNTENMKIFLNKAINTVPDLVSGKYALGLPGFSTKGRVFMEVAKAYALADDFNNSHEIIGLIESDRFYKEGISEILIIQAKKDKKGAIELASKLINHGGKIIDTKILGKIASAQAICGEFEDSLISLNKMSLGFDFSQTIIDIANYFNPQRVNLLI
mgnify:CR=1 FL=1